MAINKLVFTNNIAVGVTATQKIVEFCSDFIAWMNTNMPGGEAITHNETDPLVIDVTTRQWIPTTRAAQVGGSANTIKLITTASATNDIYNGQIITLIAGPGAGDVRTISDYDGTTKIATVSVNFSATPTASTTYQIADTWVPQWFKTAYVGAAGPVYIAAALTFTHADSNTEWCIAGLQDGSTIYGSIAIGIQQKAAGSGNTVVCGELARYSPTAPGATYVDHGETISLTIPDSAGKYKLFTKDYNANATAGNIWYYGVMMIDNPVKDTDVAAWMMFGMNDKTKHRFTTQFSAEALGTTVILTCETMILEAASLAVNVYTGKIPLGRVWAGSQNLGLRGYPSSLVVAPQSYAITNQNYAIGEDTYYGLANFDDLILLPGGSAVAVGGVVLLKV